ncbi:hypothetical protein [Asanoa siamensis]|uniref:hypothetical protein n=1 Tax=Asanoa siamensis TaxID=926357 RepID=UPI0019444CDD|nr:hypothetical protein [Asanoa siamensis]
MNSDSGTNSNNGAAQESDPSTASPKTVLLLDAASFGFSAVLVLLLVQPARRAS